MKGLQITSKRVLLKAFQRKKNFLSPQIKTFNFVFNKRLLATTSTIHNHAQNLNFDLKNFPVERIRNFSIIAHVDHGKSTLADRLLEITGTIPKGNNQQVLDSLQVERERGITVKAQTATLVYKYEGQDYLLNLIDTPGHVDFHYEVSRSLAACQGVVLLVDSNQGIQAQTVANFYLAFEMELAVIPVLNKIDLKHANPQAVAKQIKNVFDIDTSDVLKVSAKFGDSVSEVLDAVIERIPPPTYDREKPLRAFVFDSWYDKYKGVVALVSICDGILSKGDKVTCASSQKTYEVNQVGVMHPTPLICPALFAGQVGYVMMNMRNISEAQIGDTFFHEKKPVEAMPGFKPATPMVFAGVFPIDQTEYPQLRSAIDKLTLNDRSVSVSVDNSPALGQGYRLGFLGLLHMDVFNQRLEQEFDASPIITAPNVAYKMSIVGEKNIKHYKSDKITVLNPCLMPDPGIITEQFEPMVNGTIICPAEFINDITSICLNRRGVVKDQSYIDERRVILQVRFPLAEILVDFFDELKSKSSGYASFDYEDAGYQPSELVKIVFLLNGREVEELTMISHVSSARSMARQVCLKLKETLPRQQFLIAVQAKVNGKIVAREDIKAYRKDVTAKLYGGDMTRRTKLLKKQASGKKKMRQIGNIDIPKNTFIQILRKDL